MLLQQESWLIGGLWSVLAGRIWWDRFIGCALILAPNCPL